ncbi:MAG: NAD-dependent epimerase/dehydratase family protein [Bacteroidales bacterium]|nr:NAD-dependent epimerase/dehydratase family protein [Bacteroidales bacterium]
MKIFVSGATGFIGSRLALRLANEGHQVHALYRDERKVSIIQHSNIKLFKGDILDYNSLIPAIEGCSRIYHAAAFAKVWDRDSSTVYRQNIEGTVNVIRAGIHAGVRKIVCTSTAGVLGNSRPGSCVDEFTPRPLKYFNDYESSKAILEEILKTLSENGLEIVMVNPTRVYGPGVLGDSNGTTRMIKSYIQGKWHVIPGDGNNIGNYVFVEDVVSGHILAMEKGKSGERYVLGGENISYNTLFRELVELTGKKYFMVHLPLSLLVMVSGIVLFFAKISGLPPFIVPGIVRKLQRNTEVSSTKAEKELGYKPVDFKTGAALTIDWLKNQK